MADPVCHLTSAVDLAIRLRLLINHQIESGVNHGMNIGLAT